MSEANRAAHGPAARPWTLGSLIALLLVVVLGVSPTIAHTGPQRARSSADGSARSRPMALVAPIRVTLGIGSLFTTQFDGSRYANGNCNMAAGAMLFEVQTGRVASGAALRRWSGARTRGTSLGDLRRAFARRGQHIDTREDMPWGSFMREVRRGRSAVVQGWYGNLPAHLVLQAGYAGAHSVFVLGYSRHALRGKGGFYVMDPLGSGTYDGAWWSGRTLRRFGWSGRPNTVGQGRRAWFGNVALQGQPSHKQLSAGAYRPVFQSYWDTSKSLMERARSVTVVRARTGRKPSLVLRVRDARLTLSPARAQRRGLSWPLTTAGKNRAASVRNQKLVVRVGPWARVTAAATGRVVYRGWSLRNGRTLWIQHGPRLFTVYQGMRKVRVEPGQWVREGRVLGKVRTRASTPANARTAAGGSQATKVGKLRFAVAVGKSPRSRHARVNPIRFLQGARGAID